MGQELVSVNRVVYYLGRGLSCGSKLAKDGHGRDVRSSSISSAQTGGRRRGRVRDLRSHPLLVTQTAQRGDAGQRSIEICFCIHRF